MKGPPPGSTAFGLFRHPPRGGTAGGRGDPGHGGHAHGLLRGLLGVPVLAVRPVDASGPSEAMARVLPLVPSGRAEKGRAWGGHGLRSKTMLRALTRCGCLSAAPFGARSEFRSATPRMSIAGCPQRSEGTRQVGSPFFGFFLWRVKERNCAAGRTSRPAALASHATLHQAALQDSEQNQLPAQAQRAQPAIKFELSCSLKSAEARLTTARWKRAELRRP